MCTALVLGVARGHHSSRPALGGALMLGALNGEVSCSFVPLPSALQLDAPPAGVESCLTCQATTAASSLASWSLPPCLTSRTSSRSGARCRPGLGFLPHIHTEAPAPVLRLPELLPAPSWVSHPDPHGGVEGDPEVQEAAFPAAFLPPVYLPAGGTAFKGEGVPSAHVRGGWCELSSVSGLCTLAGHRLHGKTGLPAGARQGRAACAGLNCVPGARGRPPARRWSGGSHEPPKEGGTIQVHPWSFLTPNLLYLPPWAAVSRGPAFTGKPRPQDAAGRSVLQSLPGLQASAPGSAEPAWFSSPAWPCPTLGISLSLCLLQGLLILVPGAWHRASSP